MTRSRLVCSGAIVLAGLVSACSTSPPAQFYTLTSESPGADQPIAPTPFVFSISVGPVGLPEAVNRPQFVVRDGPNRVVVLEGHRWAEPLKSGIAEAVAGNLSRDLGGARVTPMTQSAAMNAQFDVSLDVQRFDLIVGDAAVIDVVWTIKSRNGDAEPMAGHSNVRESAQTSGDAYDALVAAQVRAWSSVSREIAARLLADAPK